MNALNSANNIKAGAQADLICYVGHNGLGWTLVLKVTPKGLQQKSRCHHSACASKSYFYQPIFQSGANPLLWTTGLMAPEAYVLQAAIHGWLLNETADQIRMRAAESYNKFQHCGLNGAKRYIRNRLVNLTTIE